jgi:hypothetical protein
MRARAAATSRTARTYSTCANKSGVFPRKIRHPESLWRQHASGLILCPHQNQSAAQSARLFQALPSSSPFRQRSGLLRRVPKCRSAARSRVQSFVCEFHAIRIRNHIYSNIVLSVPDLVYCDLCAKNRLFSGCNVDGRFRQFGQLLVGFSFFFKRRLKKSRALLVA